MAKNKKHLPAIRREVFFSTCDRGHLIARLYGGGDRESWHATFRLPENGSERLISLKGTKMPGRFVEEIHDHLDRLDTILRRGADGHHLGTYFLALARGIELYDQLEKLKSPYQMATADISPDSGRYSLWFSGGEERSSWSAQMVFSLPASDAVGYMPLNHRNQLDRQIKQSGFEYVGAVATAISQWRLHQLQTIFEALNLSGKTYPVLLNS